MSFGSGRGRGANKQCRIESLDLRKQTGFRPQYPVYRQEGLDQILTTSGQCVVVYYDDGSYRGHAKLGIAQEYPTFCETAMVASLPGCDGVLGWLCLYPHARLPPANKCSPRTGEAVASLNCPQSDGSPPSVRKVVSEFRRRGRPAVVTKCMEAATASGATGLAQLRIPCRADRLHG